MIAATITQLPWSEHHSLACPTPRAIGGVIATNDAPEQAAEGPSMTLILRHTIQLH
jgi:hypothetical protein